MANVTKTYHQKPYSLIDPTSPRNSQAGRTVMITGSADGVGFQIASSFIEANASHVIILSRREEQLTRAADELGKLRPSSSSSIIVPLQCDISSDGGVAALWEDLKHLGITVDVLIINAASSESRGSFLESGVLAGWKSFRLNVLSNMELTEKFLEQGPDAGKVLIDVTSSSVHSNPYPGAAYAASRAAAAKFFQHLADEILSAQVQIVNINPGAVFTETMAKIGLTKDSLPWDDPALSGSFVVWASTSQAKFLHGRFVWVNWDVEELEHWKDRLEADYGLLKIGLQGIHSVDLTKTFQEVRAFTQPGNTTPIVI